MGVYAYVMSENRESLRPLRAGRSTIGAFPDPVAHLTASTSASVTGEAVDFDASGSTGVDLEYYIDTVADINNPDNTPMGQWPLGFADSEGKLTFTFNSEGNKYIRLTVTDSFGRTDQAFYTVVVSGAIAAPSSAPTLTVQTTEDTITFTRGNVTDATSYEYESQSDQGNVITIGTDTTVVLSGLSTGTSRTIRVRGRNSGGFGPWSNWITGTTQVTEPAPADWQDAFDTGPGPLYLWFRENTGPTMEMPGTFNSFTDGNYTVSQNGAVVEDRHVTGTLRIMASNVTVRRCRARTLLFGNVNNYAQNNLVEDSWILGGTPYPVLGNGSHGALNVVRRCYVDGENRANNNGGFYGSGIRRIEFCHMRRHTDGAKMGSGTQWYYNLIEDPFDTDLWEGSGAPHVDGLQASTGESNIEIFRNYIDVVVYDNNNNFKTYSNAAIIINQNHPNTSSPSDNTLIKENFLNGGNNTLYLTDGGSTSVPPPTNGRVLRNMMGPHFRYGQYRHGSAVVSSNPAHLTADEQVDPSSGVNIVRVWNFNVSTTGKLEL